MIDCLGCKNRNHMSICNTCIGYNQYCPNGLYSEKPTDISKEMEMLAKHGLNIMFRKGRKSDMKIKKVIFNDPATIVLWKDGTKTIVKCGDEDAYDPEKGLAMAIAKKALGNVGNYYNEIKKWLPEEESKYPSLPESLTQMFDKVGKALSDIKLNVPKIPIATDVKAVEKDGGVEITGKPVTILSVEELAEKLGCTKATIQKQCREGQHPGAVKVGGKWRIPYTEH